MRSWTKVGGTRSLDQRAATANRRCAARALAGALLLSGILTQAHGATQAERPRRIISLAPSTTEILFALGLGDRVVGVSRYCDYPPGTADLVKLGGYVDPNYEEIVALRPDLVILLASHRDARAELEKLGIRTLTTPHETIEDVDRAIRMIGSTCDAEDRADALLSDLANRRRAVQRAVRGRRRPRVLVCIGRDAASGQLSGIYVAGRHGFYDQMIEMAGGLNAYRDEHVAYPQVSAEGLLLMNPDVIVDLVGSTGPPATSPQEIRKHWYRLRTVAAVRTDQVHVITEEHALRPGPRYIAFLERLARLLHPGAVAEDSTDD